MKNVSFNGVTWGNTFWIRKEDEERLDRLSWKLKIPKSRVVAVALKFYEDTLNTCEEAFGKDIYVKEGD